MGQSVYTIFSDLLIYQVYNGLFLMFSKRCSLQLLLSDLWVTSFLAESVAEPFWLIPNTNLSALLWSQSRPKISSAELLLKIVTMQRHKSSVDVQPYRCLFTVHLCPLRGGNIPAAIAAAANIAMFCLHLHCLV